MTCVVGVVEDGSVYIGADSAGIAGYDLVVRADRKVFGNDSYIFGFAGSFRMGQLIQYSFNPPIRDPNVDVHEFMATTFVDAVRDCFKAGGYAQRNNEQEFGGTFLVGHEGRLFYVMGDYQVGEPADPFIAIGCGDQVAHGALYSTVGMDPRQRVRTALEAAERFSGGVRAPFYICELHPKELSSPDANDADRPADAA